jgi:hypothetical protein
MCYRRVGSKVIDPVLEKVKAAAATDTVMKELREVIVYLNRFKLMS